MGVYFNPRSPCGERQWKNEYFIRIFSFSVYNMLFFKKHLHTNDRIPHRKPNEKCFFRCEPIEKICALALRIKAGSGLQAYMHFYSRSDLFCSDTCFQGNRTADCPFPYPLYCKVSPAGCGIELRPASIQIQSIEPADHSWHIVWQSDAAAFVRLHPLYLHHR